MAEAHLVSRIYGGRESFDSRKMNAAGICDLAGLYRQPPEMDLICDVAYYSDRQDHEAKFEAKL
jgi:hypothetical protein